MRNITLICAIFVWRSRSNMRLCDTMKHLGEYNVKRSSMDKKLNCIRLLWERYGVRLVAKVLEMNMTFPIRRYYLQTYIYIYVQICCMKKTFIRMICGHIHIFNMQR